LPQEQTLNQLAEGDIHFAFTNIGDMDQGTTEIQLYLQEPLVLIVPSGHTWTQHDQIEPERLYEERFVMRESGSGTYRNVKRGLAEHGIDIAKLNVFMEMGTSEAIALAVQQGLGIGFISQMIVKKICRDNVNVVKIRDLQILQNIYFGRQTVRPATSAEVAFWNFIRDLDTSIFK
jgi:DNA-binding transcriptional LysR family regulator